MAETTLLPLLPVKDTVIFPSIYSPLFVGREPSLLAIEEALKENKQIFITAQKSEREEVPKPTGLYQVGCLSTIIRLHKLPTGTMKILVQGVTRGKVVRFIKDSPFIQVDVRPVPEPLLEEDGGEAKELMLLIRDNLEKMISMGKMVSPDLLISIDDIREAGKFADLVVSKFGFDVNELQAVLEAFDPIERLRRVNELINTELDVLAAKREMSFGRQELDQRHREDFLRDQLRAIKNELGDADSKTEELLEYRKKIESGDLPDEVRDESLKQLRRLEGMHPDAAEASIVRTFLDWVVELPWKVSSKDNLDLERAKEILNTDHHGLDGVKDRILEFLAVCKLRKKMRGPIICLAGPPGVGKTSLGRSIAKAMGREFIRISLGGVKDEAEVRGHRRTYVGAMPGKIIFGIKQAKTNNPVFMLDEVDKLSSDFRGDPSSALLEVLDPERNNAFRDHYLNLPFDLSRVMFIATANLIDPIPPALRDRMEVIQLSGYTPEDKVQIARGFLLPKQEKEHGLKPTDLDISDRAILNVIETYTRESGVRDLERKIAAICRKTARKVAEGSASKNRVTATNLGKLLGSEKHPNVHEHEHDEVGTAVGLAWTAYGGETLVVEVKLLNGKGKLVLTGQLGDVMQESARAALSYVMGRLSEWQLPEDLLANKDVHIHVPSGATPKDGPSAGVTLITALVSAVTGVPISCKVAMTGEITLRGRVLPVGGIKEKLLAAGRQKIETVVIPGKNAQDLQDVPAQLKKRLKVVTADDVETVLDLALVGGLDALRTGKPGSGGDGERASSRHKALRTDDAQI